MADALVAMELFSELSDQQQEACAGGVTTGRTTIPIGLHDRAKYGDSTDGFNPGIYKSVVSTGTGLSGAGAKYDTTTLVNEGGDLVTKGQTVVFGQYS